MAFRKKYTSILEDKPDIIIAIECEDLSKLLELPGFEPYHFQWYGDNPNKGIAILSTENYPITLSDRYDKRYRYIIPLILHTTPKVQLFVIWAMPHKNSPTKSYVGQTWAAVHYYHKELNKPSILIGDFNSNSIWDKSRKNGNHSELVEFLNQKNIYSLYHKQNKEQHGHEHTPTQFMYRHLDKPYHLDYCFASKLLISQQTIIRIGDPDMWLSKSDHMPLFINSFCIS